MRIFITWSGSRSKKIAEYLKHWLLQLPLQIDPWISGAEIDPGTRWQKELAEALKETNYGILCVTPENQCSAWVCYEAGALSKAIDKSHVVPYLIDLVASSLEHPLKQFQAVEANKEDTWKLIKGIHKATADKTRSEKQIEEAFERRWPDLENIIRGAVKEVQVPERRKADLDQIQETLNKISAVVESLSSRFSELEQNSKTAMAPSIGTSYGIPITTATLAGMMGMYGHGSSEAGYGTPAYGVLPDHMQPPTSDFKIELAGDPARISSFIVDLNSRLEVVNLRTPNGICDKTILEFDLLRPPRKVGQVFKEMAQYHGIELSAVRSRDTIG